ncbi:MAG: glycogen synthase, partial [Gammaproteobacteria bacterium]|nr:glycogen synthase [Gammaproteobacteria bacterium]
MNILMLASENAALPAAKVGGIGDVLRDLPPSLARQGHQVSVVIPAYHHLADVAGMRPVAEVEVDWCGQSHKLTLLRLSDAHTPTPGVSLYVLQSPGFAVGERGSIYHHDPSHSPFATDATLFALFCRGAMQAVVEGHCGAVDVLHLHDWHTALCALLLRHDKRFASLRTARLVYTIHNLALQGVRPFKGHPSSLESWYPELEYVTDEIVDPRALDCVNLMRVGIAYADRVHAVSPTYAEEITRPSDPSRGFFGGEGLEASLKDARQDNRLFGILNGCVYADRPPARARHLPALHRACRELALRWMGSTPVMNPAHYIAVERLRDLKKLPASMFMMTSVGRITTQKIALLRCPFGRRTALDVMLEELAGRGALVVVGTGDEELENFLVNASSRHANFVYLRGYAEKVSELLYEMGDLFLMPSSFEPCGISQMLAMRAGQPCLVHATGGLKDTVSDNQDGFVFSGADPGAQAQMMIEKLRSALEIFDNHPQQWQKIRSQAAKARFEWDDTSRLYLENLYSKETAPSPT